MTNSIFVSAERQCRISHAVIRLSACCRKVESGNVHREIAYRPRDGQIIAPFQIGPLRIKSANRSQLGQ